MKAMELDELKSSWQAMNDRMEKLHAAQTQLEVQAKLGESKDSLRPLRTGQCFQIAAGVGTMMVVGPIWFRHLGVFHLMLPALLLHLYGLMMVISAGRTLALAAGVDYSQPVVEIQSRLAKLRLWRATVEQPIYAVLGCFIWIPLMMVLFNGVGVDLWVHAPKYVYALIASGFVALGVVSLVLRKARFAIESHFAGASIKKAQSELEEIARFAQES